MPADKFSPNGNPQDRAVIIDPAKYLPANFTPIYGDQADADATIAAVAADMQAQIDGGAPLNQVLNTGLQILGTVLGAAKIPII